VEARCATSHRGRALKRHQQIAMALQLGRAEEQRWVETRTKWKEWGVEPVALVTVTALVREQARGLDPVRVRMGKPPPLMVATPSLMSPQMIRKPLKTSLRLLRHQQIAMAHQPVKEVVRP